MSLIGPRPPLVAQTIGIFNALIPAENPKCIPYNIDFSTGANQVINLTLAQQQKQISLVQTIYVDNSLSSAQTEIVCQSSGQVIKVPPGAEGYFPVITSNPPIFNLTNPSGVVVQVYILNVPINGQLWSSLASGTLVSDAVLDATVYNGAVRTVSSVGALTSRSITTPSTPASTQLFPYNANRAYMMFQSPKAGSGIWVNFAGGTASVGGTDCIFMPAQQVYETGPRVTNSIVNVYDPTGSLVIPAFEG